MGKSGGGDVDVPEVEVTPVAPPSPAPREAEAAQKARKEQNERVRRAFSSDKTLLSRGAGELTPGAQETLGAK